MASSLEKTLEQLRQIREKGVSELTGKLAQQKQLCQRYEKNIEALTSLCESSGEFIVAHAAHMSNHSNYKRVIQRVIDWQKQEHALVDKQAENTREHLVKAACKEKTVALVLEKRKQQIRQAQSRKEQQITDGQSLQSWMRQRRR